MVDLKFFDVPETVKLAVKQLRNRGVTFATVHGNDPILRAAVAERHDVKILAVTVLTSFGEEDMLEMFGVKCKVEDLVFVRAKRAFDLGCDGVISSGLESKRLRDNLGDNFLIVTPGIRPGANITIKQDDQRRIVTAGEAIANGADYRSDSQWGRLRGSWTSDKHGARPDRHGGTTAERNCESP
ncbi:putative Orotidine-5'-phosphate decarboxylase [Syntrophobacter sp. SbD1]|nr:putative Orotidine-5'-phosphate decarboxylase [Syntrophobacter sp. SbD1]